MHYFIEKTADGIKVYRAGKRTQPPKGMFVVGSPADLVNAPLTNKDLLSVFNSAQEKPLVKFKNRKSAVERTFDVFKQVAKDIPEQDLSRIKSVSKPSKRKTSRRKGIINLEPHVKAYPARMGSKQAALIDMLDTGATMDDLRRAVQMPGKKDWKDSSIKSGLYWDINKVKGYGIRTELMNGRQLWELYSVTETDWPLSHIHPDDATDEEIEKAEQDPNYSGEAIYPVYFLVLPEGVDKPLPHVTGKNA